MFTTEPAAVTASSPTSTGATNTYLYAALEVVSNYGEGLVSTEWTGGEAFRDFQGRWSRPSAETILSVVRTLDPDDESCGCSSYRWRSMLS